MAERRARLPAVGGPPDDTLAELNDHLGRFLRQADELLDEWARFGAGVRGSLEAQLREVETAFAAGADAAAARATAALGRGLDEAAAARVDRVLGERVASLRAELERLERIARGLAGGAAARGPDAAILARRTWIAAIAANVLLVVLIALVWLRGRSPDAPVPAPPNVQQPAIAPPVVDARPPDAGVPDAGAPDAALPPDAAPAHPAGRGAIRGRVPAPRAAAPAPHP